jgi:hypothetical protein
MKIVKRLRMPRRRNGVLAGWNLVKGIMVIRENGSYADFLRAVSNK